MDPPSKGLLYFPIIDANGNLAAIAPGSKRRRLRGACDTCRQRKIRCDSTKMPGNVCSNCIAFNSPCTHHNYAAKKNVASRPRVAASEVETDLQLAQKLDPDVKTAEEHVQAILVQSTAYIATRDLRNTLLDVARYSRSLEQQIETLKSKLNTSQDAQLSVSRDSSMALSPPSTTDKDVADHADSTPEGLVLCDEFEALALDNARNRYFGRSSGFYLIQTAREMKQMHDGPNVLQPKPVRRPEFWHSPWEERLPAPPPVFRFPPRDLLDSLVSIFFKRINILVFLLHEPTFRGDIVRGLHLVDPPFGAVVMGVCALAARYSEDPRVVLEGTNSRLSSGWAWFRQLQDYHYRTDTTHDAPTLYQLQLICLWILYAQGTCSPESCWTMVAVGIRHVQELGLHMRSRFDRATMTVEDELLKRAAWVLIISDSLISSFLGRPRVMHDNDYDLDYPVDCDEEYWGNPDPRKRFQQPEGQPSMQAFIVSYCKLTEILGMAQKTIYSVGRGKRFRGAGWSQSAVAELDSALNQWVDTIPDHLRWDPHREDETFATQSACLFTAYYHVQIQIHRTFISSPSNDATLATTFPSLAICANSARSCSHIMEAQAAKHGLVAHPQAVSALMDSAIVLLLNVWGGHRTSTGPAPDPYRAATDVQKCINVLKMYERRWQIAGRYCDSLFSVGNQLISTYASQAPAKTLKRGRDTVDSLPPTDIPAPLEPRPIASSHRVAAAVQQQEFKGSQPQLSAEPYALPVSTEELGHLPVYESFDWWLPSGNNSSFGHDAWSEFDYNSFPTTGDQQFSHNGFMDNDGDWATRDWSKYIVNFDHIMQSLESSGIASGQ
ncbi:fungal-specific transcription factor domain-containing protein [Mycena belliarum]|uniref:Fungal-specific transcription factor domain-containing protein n=1 Tax=Mycena belliarum TaxID=1033014 RepID=A0AAD6XQF8_9AGAR|nr:fungal-specific transcription factor domain-containing protein [Mycena belliae]